MCYNVTMKMQPQATLEWIVNDKGEIQHGTCVPDDNYLRHIDDLPDPSKFKLGPLPATTSTSQATEAASATKLDP